MKKGCFGFLAAIFESANAQDDEPELTKEEKEALKEEKKKAKEEKKALKAEKKKAKEEKKKAKEAAKPKKEKKPKEEGPKEKGKPLPKLKTILIFLLAASIVVLFKFGMDFLSYNMMVDKAKSAFTNSNFTEAYNTISGYKVKPTEQKLQKQIVLVNKLYKHLNSYENLVQIKIYTQALNQLLNGVKQYDEAIKEAEELGVKEQYDTILDKLSSRLISGFGIGLSRAREIIAYNDEILYSNAIYEIISEKYGADAK